MYVNTHFQSGLSPISSISLTSSKGAHPLSLFNTIKLLDFYKYDRLIRLTQLL